MGDIPDDRVVAINAIGPRDAAKILFVSRFRHHQQTNGKNDKGEIRVLAITTHRLYIVSTSKTPKVEHSFHILEVISLEGVRSMSTTLNDTYLFQLAAMMQVGDKQVQHRFLFENEEHVGTVISFVISLLRTTFVDANVEKQVSWKISPVARQTSVEESIESLSKAISEEGVGCGGFSQAYLCMCDYYKQVSDHIAEVCWDIDKIYASHACKDFKLEDFDRLEMKDLVPLVATLAYNTWFTSLVVTNLKLSNEMIDVIAKVVKRTLSIQSFVLKDCHLNKEQMQKISVSLSLNGNKVIKRLDFSGNQLEDKGVGSLCGTLATMSYGIEHLHLNEVALTNKGAGAVVNCLKQNKQMNTSLQLLNLSGNAIKQEGVQSLCDVFSQPNVLRELSLSSTECPLDLLFTALHRGCQLHLEHLDLSNNSFFGKKKDVSSLSSLQQFFSMCRALKSVNLSNTKVPSSGVKAVLMGLINNPTLTDISLDLSNNDLRSQGAEEFTSCVEDIALSSLNLSNNGLEGDLIPLCEALQNNRTIKELDLSSNVNKAKNIRAIADAMSDILEAETALTRVSVADNKLRVHAGLLFDALGTNETLQALDIRGNIVGDEGARMLAKALQINTKLQEIYLDRNNITSKGLQDISQAMERNFSLHSLPLPITDLTATMKTNTSPLFLKSYAVIEQALMRNQSSKQSTPEQAYKVHRGLLVSSTDQYIQQMDEYVVQLQDTIAKVKNVGGDSAEAEVAVAVKLLKEVEEFEHVVSDLYADPQHSKNILDEMFEKVTTDIVSSVEGVVNETVDKMLRSAVGSCPTALNKESELKTIKEEILKNDTLLQKSSISDSIMGLGRNEITYKLCECHLVVATNIAEHLKNLFVSALENSNKSLKALCEKQQNESVQPQENVKPEDSTVPPSPEVHKTPIPLITPPVTPSSDTGKDNMFDLTMDFSRARSLKRGALLSVGSDTSDGENTLTVDKRRYTDTFSGDKKRDRKKKTCSLKRRPTFYRDSQEIQEVETTTNASGSIQEGEVEVDGPPVTTPKLGNSFLAELTNKQTERSKSTEEEEENGSEPQRTASFTGANDVQVERSSSVSGDAFDEISKQSKQLSVIKKVAKPKGRRAPKRVSKLAHMNVDDSASMQNELKPLSKPQRPVSEFVPSANPMFEESAIRPRVGTEKLKREPPARPNPPTPSKPDHPSRPELPITPGKGEAPSRPERPKKPSEVEKKAETPPVKEKKVKPPTGAFQLPALPNLGGILKKRPAPKAPDAVAVETASKVEDSESESKQKDTGTAGETEKVDDASQVDTPPTKPPPPSKASSLKRSNSPNPPSDGAEVPPAADPEDVKSPESAAEPPATVAKPSPVKKPPRGIPLGGGLGGSALMAEMNKKLHIPPKNEETETEVAVEKSAETAGSTPVPVNPPATASKPAVAVPHKPPKPIPPQAPAKPSPPQRPPSLKRSTENRPNVPDRPKVMTRPSKDVIDGLDKTPTPTTPTSTTDEPKKSEDVSNSSEPVTTADDVVERGEAAYV